MSRRRILVKGAVAIVVLGLIAAAVFVVIGRRMSGPAPVDQVAAGPVMLVPGYGGSTNALRAMATRLREQGREVRLVPPLGNGRGDLREQAQALDTAVQAELDAGAPSVDVVGYSAGGVVTRLWVKEFGGAGKARRIVTLGSPHHGAETAAIGAALAVAECEEACLQLAPGSDLLTQLNRGDETPDGPRWVSIWSRTDGFVTPPDTARLDGAVNIELQQVCAGADTKHGQLPTDPLPLALTLQALDEGLDAPPDAASCAVLQSGTRSNPATSEATGIGVPTS